MGSYALSRLADGDVLAIARDSVQNWGVDQAERYVLGLHSAFELLAQFPELGRRIDHIRARVLAYGKRPSCGVLSSDRSRYFDRSRVA